ncbi:hypothetical protein Barb4_02527 [Bacteroidales bacterium Barb4]|nr:hypothetical protein Barb4_02527 [Bacteroidales bacterium Barb4]
MYSLRLLCTVFGISVCFVILTVRKNYGDAFILAARKSIKKNGRAKENRRKEKIPYLWYFTERQERFISHQSV